MKVRRSSGQLLGIKIDRKWYQKFSQNFLENPPKINQKSIKNRPKIIQNRGQGGSWSLSRRLGCVLGLLEGILPGFGRVLGRLGSVLGASWARLGTSWARLGASWAPLGPSWRRLGPQDKSASRSMRCGGPRSPSRPPPSYGVILRSHPEPQRPAPR